MSGQKRIELLELLKEEAMEIDRYMQQDLQGVEPALDGRLERILEYGLFTGGKRVRPLLAVIASRLCGRRDEEVYRLAIAFEYLHAATLFHDDIIDSSEIRRGKPSVVKQFGLAEAILAGDFLHAHAMAIVGELAGRQGLAIFCRATKGMVDGEFMQLHNTRRKSLSEVEYFQTIMGKTALLIATACEVGAGFGGGNATQIEALRVYGESIGCAFQIVDDLLDYSGDSEVTGKATGIDLLEGKITLPIIFAAEQADRVDRDRLIEIVATPELAAVSFAEVKAIIEKYGGFATARARAQSESEKALAMLDQFPGEAVATERAMLESLALYVVSRQK
jgi:octaprenyl-diphosphate synthase